MKLIATSSTHASNQTSGDANERIRRDMEMRVRGYATQPEDAITRRPRGDFKEVAQPNCGLERAEAALRAVRL